MLGGEEGRGEGREGGSRTCTVPAGLLHPSWRSGTPADGLDVSRQRARLRVHEWHGGNPATTLARAQRTPYLYLRDIVVRRPARLSVAVPPGHLCRLPLEEVADEVADTGEETTASHDVVVVGVVVLLLCCC